MGHDWQSWSLPLTQIVCHIFLPTIPCFQSINLVGHSLWLLGHIYCSFVVICPLVNSLAWLSLPDLFFFLICHFHQLSFSFALLCKAGFNLALVPICYLFCWYVTVTVLYLHYVTIIDCWSSSFSYDLISFVIFLPHLSFSLAVTSAPLNWDTWWQIWARSWRTKK